MTLFVFRTFVVNTMIFSKQRIIQTISSKVEQVRNNLARVGLRFINREA